MFSDDGSEIEFFGNNLWNYYDNVISTNFLSFDYYGFDKDGKISSPKFKITIAGKTSNKDAKLTFDSCSLYKFNYQLRTEIMSKIKDDLVKFKQNQKWSHGFVYNGYKKNIYVTVMWNDLSNSAVIRFMIGEKERTILDSDKVYIPIIEFFSLFEILNQSFSNYVNLCSVCNLESNIVRLQKITDNISTDIPVSATEIFSSEDKLRNLDLSSISSSQTTEKDAKLAILGEITDQEEKVIDSSVDKESFQNQNSFDSFLTENRDKFELDLPDTSDTIQPEKDHHIKNELDGYVSKFITKICNNDFTIFEQLIFNNSNEILPFDSFVKRVKEMSDIDFKDGMKDSDYIAVNYVISNTVKYHINNLLEKKLKLPSNITPIIIKNEKKDNDKIDMMYYLLLFYIYLSKIRVILSEKTSNSIDNKEYFSYVLKTISNPLVFSYFPSISEDVLKNETCSRYRNLLQNKFFDKFVEGIKSKIKVNDILVTENDIKESITKIYDSVIRFKDRLGVENAFNCSIMKLDYKTLNIDNISTEVLKKIIYFDTSFNKYGKVDNKIDLKSYDDVPVSILKIFGIKVVKFDNTIITKYFTDNFKDFADLEKIKRINKNVYDIIDEIDISTYDIKQLRALYYWNVDILPKDLTYYRFKQLIDSSSLDRGELISMILNRTINVDKDFYHSFLISGSDGTEI